MSRWRMVSRGGKRLLTAVLLLLVAKCAVIAQGQVSGLLSGKLTDLHSRPLDGATVILRESRTGIEARTTTKSNGSYRFSDLPPGEYTLRAESPQLGTGSVEGIVVSAGHEARVQAALQLHREAPKPLVAANALDKSLSPARAPERLIVDRAMPAKPKLAATSSTSAVRLAASPVESPRLHRRPGARPREDSRISDATGMAANAIAPPAQSRPLPTIKAEQRPGQLAEATEPASALALALASGSAAGPIATRLPSLAVVHAAAMSSNGRSVALTAAMAALKVLQLPPAMVSGLVGANMGELVIGANVPPIPAEQLEALPVAGRRWENFVSATPDAASAAETEDSVENHSARHSASVTVDGARTRLAFGNRGQDSEAGSSLMGPGRSEAAILAVQPSDGRNGAGSAGESVRVATRSGGNQMHGQAFVFERQNLWGAQNPFTQWVRETAPATLTTTPVFTPQMYSPPDREATWGGGLGGPMLRHRIFWFAAVDASQRNNPGVSSVKHPDHFFAQPSNDEMQVLSARLGMSSLNPVAEGLSAYSKMLESLAGLLGSAPRTSTRWVGSGRLDGNADERNHLTLQGSGTLWNSPGGGLSSTSETYGNRSFGTTRASETWLLGRWETYLTPNLLAVTQGSMARQIFAQQASTPSSFEQSLNVSAWGKLPQIVVDGTYGFTIGTPARFGSGSFPDEHVFAAQQGIDWVHGKLLMSAGASLSHNADSTGMVPNHAGTYHYSSVENFASDALVFATYGLSNALDPLNQHNCDQRGKAWRDTAGQLHGLGYLPCYSYYSQTLGPTNWHMSTNDWAAFATTQWQPAKRLVMSASMRWQREKLSPPIALVDNPELPLSQRLPSLGNEWVPRASLAWGIGESHWLVLRLGYGMYFGRTRNAVLETALTQTGSLKGDLNFFLRPTDNLNAGGAPPFPYVLAGEPSSVVKPGAVEFAPGFHNAEIHQATASIEETLPGRIQLAATAVASLGRRLPVTVDTNYDPALNPGTITYSVVDSSGKGPIKTPQITVPFFASWPSLTSPTGFGGRLNPHFQQISEIMSRANSTYEAVLVRLSRSGRHGVGFQARYVYGHAMDWNPNESSQVTGSELLEPGSLSQEYGTSSLDVRHSLSAALVLQAPWKLHHLGGWLANGWTLSGTGRFRTGLPYTMRTSGSIPEEFTTAGAAIVGLGPGMNGYGADNRVYGVGRNTYRHPAVWKADVRVGRVFKMGAKREFQLMAESFNLFNHQNVTRVETTGYSIQSGNRTGAFPTLNFLTGLKKGQIEFGQPLGINATDLFRERQIDFGMRVRF
jgi:hypothetical protein